MTNRNAKKCVGLSLLGVLTAAMVFCTPAIAQPKFDKTIAKATADQVAKKLGDLRDSIDVNESLVLVPLSVLGKQETRDNFRTHSIKSRISTGFQGDRRYDETAMNNVRIIYTGTIIEN